MRSGNRILVVGDDSFVRTKLKRVLAGEGYRVRAAADGEAALHAAAAARPDLVILDLKLREENGWDLFGRFTRKWPSLPMVVISARPNQLFTALAAGVGALLEKPLHIPKILSAIRHLLRDSAEFPLARLAGTPPSFHYVPALRRASA